MKTRFFIEGDTFCSFEAEMAEAPRLGDLIGHPHDAIYDEAFEVVNRYWCFADDKTHFPREHPVSGHTYHVPHFVDVWIAPVDG